MRRKNIRIKASVILLLFMAGFVVSASAQRALVTVFCNEGNSLRDTISFPSSRYNETIKGVNYVPWKFIVSDAVGTYTLRVSSYQRFHPALYQFRGGRLPWLNIASTLKTARNRSGRIWYYWDIITIRQRREPLNHMELLLLVRPSRSRQSITTTWKTTQCNRTNTRITPRVTPTPRPRQRRNTGRGRSILWTDTARSLRQKTGQVFTFRCPPNGSVRTVWGSTIYTDDSSICSAAVNAGVITLRGGGVVTIRMLSGRSSYNESFRNGVRTYSYKRWYGSFRFVR